MKKELKDLLHVLLLCIIKNGENSINNGIGNIVVAIHRDVDFAEHVFDYMLTALTEFKHLKNGEKVDFKNVKDALNHCMKNARCTKQNAKKIIKWYKAYVGYAEYEPSDELLDELVELLKK